MTASKSASPKGAKGAPKFDGHQPAHGAPKKAATDPKAGKAALLERMKVAAKKGG